MTNLNLMREFPVNGITAEDVLVVMANIDLTTSAELDRRNIQPHVGTPWAMGFVDRNGELIEGLEEFEWWIVDMGSDDLPEYFIDE